MSALVLVLAYLGTWNVFRLHPGLPADRPVGRRTVVVAGGAVLAVCAVSVVASVSDSIADWLDVTGDTIRVAVGAVVVVAGLRDLLARAPAAPVLPGWRAALIPVFFPLLFSPVAALLAISGAVDLGVLAVSAASVVGAAPVVVSTRWPSNGTGSDTARRAVAAGLVAVGVVLVASGLANL